MHQPLVGGGRRRAMASTLAAGILVILAAVTLLATTQRHASLASAGSGSSLESLEHDTFEDSGDIYRSELAAMRKHRAPSSEALAWANGGGSSRRPSGLAGKLASIEKDMARQEREVRALGSDAGSAGSEQKSEVRAGGGQMGGNIVSDIAKAVTRQVLDRLGRGGEEERGRSRGGKGKGRREDEEEEEGREGRRPKDGAVRRAERRLETDRRREMKDEREAHHLLARMATLAKSFETPYNPSSSEPFRAPLPLSDDLQPSSVGPSSAHNYWGGDHYHDEAGPQGVRTESFVDDAANGDATAEVEEGGAAREEGEGGGDKWAKRDNREKLQALGVNVMSANTPVWVSSDAGPAEANLREGQAEAGVKERLHKAGVVTNSAKYRDAIPLPEYQADPGQQDVNEALEEGHRYVDPKEEKLRQAGVNVVAGNALLPQTRFEGQKKYPYLDGVSDNMVAKETAAKHRPLWFMLDDPKRKSRDLEGHGVNVWGSPVGGFFGGEDTGSEKLKEAGVRVSRNSLITRHAPTPEGP